MRHAVVELCRAAIVTGGAGGMGLATARILGRDHRVVIADVDQQRLDDAVALLSKDGVDAVSARMASKLTARANLAPRHLRSGLAYSLSKTFVMWYSQEMATRFGAQGARILSVSPGSFDTTMGRLEEKSGSHKLLEYTALHRYGKPEEIAEVLAFCASDRPGYLTGVDILCDGGTKAGMDLNGTLAMARGN